jgi:RND family efflux transporter MFP subunit
MALALGLSVTGCTTKTPPIAELPPPAVTVAQPIERMQVDYDEYTGETEAVESVEIRARVSGYLIAVNFKDGDIVEKGKLLFEIDPRQYQAQVDQVTAQIAGLKAQKQLADVELGRYEKLVRTNAGTREDLDKAVALKASVEADIAKAEAQLAQAKLDLEFTKITAPIDGRMSRALLTVGNLVSADRSVGEPLTTIVSVDPIYAYFDIDEQSLLRYQKRTRENSGTKYTVRELAIPVTMALADQAGFVHPGVLDFAENRVNRDTGTIRARAVFENKEGKLTPGLFARVRLPASDPHEAILVTERAIGADQGLKYLLVVNDQNIAERRDVELGRLTDGMRVVAKGLSPQDWVVIDGLMRVRPGIKVKPEKENMPTPEGFSAAGTEEVISKPTESVVTPVPTPGEATPPTTVEPKAEEKPDMK